MASRLAKAISHVGSQRKRYFRRHNDDKRKTDSSHATVSHEESTLLEESCCVPLQDLRAVADDNDDDSDVIMGHRRDPAAPRRGSLKDVVFDGEVCLITDSPYRILKVSKSRDYLVLL